MIRRFAFCLFAGSLAVTAAEPASAPDPAGFHLKNRSTFTSEETTRPPFWPIGWVKQTGQSTIQSVASAPVEMKFDPDKYSVTSILLGRPSLAVINGKSYGEGEFIRNGRSKGAPAMAKVQVRQIADGQVILASGDQTAAIPLRRPQLSEHKSDDDLVPLSER